MQKQIISWSARQAGIKWKKWCNTTGCRLKQLYLLIKHLILSHETENLALCNKWKDVGEVIFWWSANMQKSQALRNLLWSSKRKQINNNKTFLHFRAFIFQGIKLFCISTFIIWSLNKILNRHSFRMFSLIQTVFQSVFPLNRLYFIKTNLFFRF